MRKKSIIVFMCGLLTICFTACSANSSGNENGNASTDSPSSDSIVAEEEEKQIESNETQEESDATESIEEIEELISVEAVTSEEGEVAVFITNNSNTVVDELEVEILYMDASGTTIDMDKDGHDMVLPGSTVVSRMEAPDSYDDYETSFSIEIGSYPSYENHAADVTVNANMGEDCVIIEITNDGEVDIEEIEYIVLLYNGDTLVEVCYPQDVYDVEAGDTITEKESTYSTEYNSFEVYLNQAHTFS